ncbi:MAG TPA: sensor domain-containing diguanylate cyclase [Geobacteraceae bacterium]
MRKRVHMIILDKVSYGRLVDNLYDGLYIVDRDRIIQYWNKAAERITGFTATEVVGKSCSDNILTHVNDNGIHLCLEKCPLAMTMDDREVREAEVFLHHKDGHRVPVSVRTNILSDESGNEIGGVEIFTDISSIKYNELRIKELEEMALLDNLTKLANRNFLDKELYVRFEEKKRFGVPFGILFMDIDHFKTFNDTYGHDVGDRVLKFVADTLVGNSRPFDVIGRWGGEEFIGIMRNVSSQQLEVLGNRLRMLVESSYIQTESDKLRVTISIGATLVCDDDNADTLIKRADSLLYKSKNSGRNRLTLA